MMSKTHSAALPNVLAIVPAFTPSTQINVTTPLLDLCASRNLDFRLQLENTVKTMDIDWADVIVLCRNIEPGQAWFQHVLKQKKPYIYDIDDNFFDIPGDSFEARYYRASERINTFTQYLQYASLVRVYSEPLRLRVQEINNRVIKVVPPLDFRHIRPRRNSGDTIKIVYATSRTHDELFSIFLPALEKLLKSHHTKIHVYFLGFTPATLQKHPRVHSIPMIWDYPAYLRNFSSAGYDIGLAPLLDDVFHRSKTNNKFREYGACQIAGIYSNVDVYTSCVRHNETGLLVSNTVNDWYDAMTLLIENKELRRKIQLAAYEFVRNNFSQEEFTETWAVQIKGVLNAQVPEQYSVPVVQVDGTLNNYRESFKKKIYNKFSQSNSWKSFLSLAVRFIRRYVSTTFIFWKYQLKIWCVSFKN